MDESPERLTGVLLGGSGLIGGTILYHFKTVDPSRIRVLSPNSKELSLRVPSDVQRFFEQVKADFIVNCAIAELDSDPQMTAEINCLGALYLARVAIELGIPYIHLSSGALMQNGDPVGTDQRLPLEADLPNYAKGKLIAERAIEELGRTRGLDYTIIRLGIVYGTHDHKIRGFHRLLLTLLEGALPVLPTRRNARHSYTNARKLPGFVAHVLERREEFGGETLHFVDPEPVYLGELMLRMKRELGLARPLEVYLPYPLAQLMVRLLPLLLWLVSRLGADARAPSELIFFERFYQTQVLDTRELIRSSWVDPEPDWTIYDELPDLVRYYVQRWENLNLIRPRMRHWDATQVFADEFELTPDRLVTRLVSEAQKPFLLECPIAHEDDESED
ncbi:MAG: NAD-dependent epimerase/dehydratase family protein [Myxococcota bacterium]